MKFSFLKLLLPCLGLACSLISLSAQEQLSISKRVGAFKFDGIVDDSCWLNVAPFPMVMHTPNFGNAVSERSEIMICYDNSFLYVGARLFDSEASKMLATSKKRDELSGTNENLTIIFDSFNDKENAVAFSTTPTALRCDFTIFKDAMTQLPDIPINESWNTFWDVKTTRNPEGWFVEMKIPLSSIRFKEINGKVIMGLICTRRIAHKNEIDIFPSIPPKWGMFSSYRPSKAQEVVFEGIHSKKPLYIAPYAIGGYQQNSVLNSGETAYHLDSKPSFNIGLDTKFGLTNNLTMDLTVNTDFAQVESDDQQINLTRFSLFFPEKRTFFQERSSIFSYDFEMGNSMFYSRRIGLYEGEQVPILGGVRITGMAGKWDLGFLNMQTSAFTPSDQSLGSISSQNFGILRIRRQVINENSYIGGIITNQLGTNGNFNTAYGIDGIFRILGNDYLNLKLSQNISDSTDKNIFSANPTSIYINWKRFTNKGFGYEFSCTRNGRDFNPSMGFMMRTNYTNYFTNFAYGWMPGTSSLLMNYKLGIIATAYTDNATKNLETILSGLNYEFTFKSEMMGVVSIGYEYENVIDTFSLSKNAIIPSGKYGFVQLESHMMTPQSNKLSVGIDFWAGNFYDGKRISLRLVPQWNVGSALQLSLAGEINRVVFPDRNQSFTGTISKIKALVMFTTKLSLSSFIQYNSADNAMLTNVRLRYNPREGNDFYIVFNEGRNTFPTSETPRLPNVSLRSVLLKYTYTFSL